jgi:hypothetical protein
MRPFDSKERRAPPRVLLVDDHHAMLMRAAGARHRPLMRDQLT